MPRCACVVLGLLTMAGGVACGPSQAELASQANAAAAARAEAAEENAASEARAQAAAEAKVAMDQVNAEATKALSRAETKAAELRARADRIDVEVAKLREASSLAEAKGKVASSGTNAGDLRDLADRLVAEERRRVEAMVAAATANPRSVIVCGVERALLRAGRFMMGEQDNTYQATVAAFCMDWTEVTVSAYEACVKAGACTPAGTGWSCNAGQMGKENHPINCVDWSQAVAYCRAQGQRLPTEVEWEYAARGTTVHTYPWGSDTPSSQLCWNGEGNDVGNGERRSTCPVGAYPRDRSPFGIYDMVGNVQEWIVSMPNSSPLSWGRHTRGGDWKSRSARWNLVTNRDWNNASDQRETVGFRCASSPRL